MGQEREQRRVWLPHDDLDRRALTASHLPDDPPRAAEGTDPGGRAVRGLVGGDPFGEGRDDLIGPERGAVVKQDILAEPEGPDQPVAGDGPRRRESGLDVASLAECDQALVEQAHRQELGRRRGLRRIETRRNVEHADVKLGGRRRAGEAGDGEQYDEADKDCRARRTPGTPTPSSSPGAHWRPL
jgi:hypothetical protein